MLEQSRSPLLRYGFAVAMVVVSLGLKLLISSEHMTNNPFLLFSATVAVSAWYGGVWAGLLAAILAAACGEYFFLMPFYSFGGHTYGQSLALGVFLIEGVAISWVVAALYTAKRKSEIYVRGLENTQDQFRQIAENIDCLIWMTDIQKTQLFYVSPQYEQMWGRSLESLSKDPSSFLESVHPEDRDRVRTALAKQSSGEYNEEYRTLDPDGTVRWVRSRAFPIRDRLGAVYRVAGIVDDITERKQIELEFLEANERYQLASTAVNCVIYDWHLESQKVERSESLTQLLGYPSEATGQGAEWWGSLLHPDDRERAYNAMKKALEQQEKFDIEYRVRHQDGTYLDVCDRGGILRDETGKAVRVIGTTIDISDRKKSEIELQKREELFRTSVENLLDCFGIYTAVRDESGRILDFRIEYVNAAACASNEYSWEEQVGKRLCDLFPAHRTTSLFEEYCQVVEGRKPLVKDSVVYAEEVGSGSRLIKAFDIRVAAFGDGFLATWRDITQRQRVENELYRREREFKALAENSPDIIARFNREMRHIYINRAIERVTGRAPEEFLGKTNSETGFPESQSGDWEWAIAQVFASGEEGEIECDLTDTKGGTRHYQSRLVPEFDRHAEVESVLVLSRDVTEYKRARAASDRSEERLRVALESAKLGLWDYDLQKQTLAGSRRCYEMFGIDLSSKEIDYEIFVQCLHPEDQDRMEQAIQRAIKAHVDYDIEYRVVRKDGTVRWIAAKGRAFYDEWGTATRMGGVVLDMTERKKAEEERDRLLQQLEFEQQLLKAVLQQMPAGAIVAESPSGRVLLSNKQAQAIWDGAIAEEKDLEDYRLFQGIHPDGRPYQPHELPMSRAIALGETVIDEEIEFPLSTGSSQIVCLSAKPVKNLAGQIVAGVVMFYDISDRKLAERQREELLLREQEARKQAEAASRMKDEFLAIVSHELRSPLNAILGWSRLLRRRKLNPEKMAQALEAIERNAEMQTQLIEDLLDISRIIRGKVRLYLRPLQLISPIEAAIDTVRPTAEIKKIEIVTTLDPGVGMVSADGDRLQQVVWNLLSNAVKFTREGGRVEICLERVNNWVQIRIIDSGIGIEPEFLPYMFERFRQADSKTTRSHGGLGLGLAIVRNLVELHGGQIFADSAGPGNGSTFIVQLPRLEDIPDAIAEPVLETSWVEGDQSSSELAGLKILVVDDEFDTREFLITALEQYGAEVFAAASTAQAIALVQENQPQILLSDIGMPGEDGYTLIRKLRSLPPEQGGQIPAAALTAYTRTEDRILALAAGFQMHIPKPIDPRHLIDVVGQLRPVQKGMKQV